MSDAIKAELVFRIRPFGEGAFTVKVKAPINENLKTISGNYT